MVGDILCLHLTMTPRKIRSSENPDSLTVIQLIGLREKAKKRQKRAARIAIGQQI